MPMSDLLLTENRDGVLVVTFNRAEKKNAINTEMWVAIRETFRGAAEDDPEADLRAQSSHQLGSRLSD